MVAAYLVASAHLRRIKAYKRLDIQRSLYDSIQERVEKKIKIWENMGNQNYAYRNEDEDFLLKIEN